KLLAVFSHLGSVAVIWSVAQRRGLRQPLACTIAYAWNPLILTETAWNAHNDVVMLLLLCLSALCYVRGRPLLGLVLLSLSILTKWVSALALPFYFLLLLRAAGSRRARVG